MPAAAARARRRAPAPVVVPIPDPPADQPPCAQIAALNRGAAATEKLADEIRQAREALQPAADVIAGMGSRLDGLCAFLKKWGPWALASAPAVLVSIGAISPNLAAVLKTLLAQAGVQ